MDLIRKYDRTRGSRDVNGLRVPALALDEQSVTLVWDKPENMEGVADYAVFQDGVRIGTARENFARHADWASTYMEAFYAYYREKQIPMVEVDIHSFTATGLSPDTEYEFSVAALGKSGTVLGGACSIRVTTAARPREYLVTDFGARPVKEGYTSYDSGVSRAIEANTRAIQAAIDACEAGGRVVIPEGIFMSGSLYLKSNMTLELKKGALLMGSPNVDHYDGNYLLYPYSTDTRAWGLINAYSSDHRAPLTNIRIVGEGVIDGNGWKYGAEETPAGDRFGAAFQPLLEGDPEKEEYRLPQWVAGTSGLLCGEKNREKSLGILAADAVLKSRERGAGEKAAYYSRPNLILIRGIENFYIGGITVRNPAFHTVAVLDSCNVTAENVKFITYDCNNADGIELGNTQNAVVFNNFFDTGDDAVNFATGMGRGVRDCGQRPSENIWTFNNFLRECHGGAIAAGSHTGAGICGMLVEDNVLNHSDMPFRFKSAPANGGGVWDVCIRDCAVGHARQVFVMNTAYSDMNQAVSVEPAERPAEFYGIEAYNITADGVSQNTMSLVADADFRQLYKPWHRHHDLYFQDIAFTHAKAGTEVLVGLENAVFCNVTVNGETESCSAWKQIRACSGLTFAGGTTMSDTAKLAMEAPVWGANARVSAVMVEGSAGETLAELQWTAAEGAGQAVEYIVETCVVRGAETCVKHSGESAGHGGEIESAGGGIEPAGRDTGRPVHVTEPVKALCAVQRGLCAGVSYRFTVFAVNEAGNRTKGPSVSVAAAPGKSPALAQPDSLEVEMAGQGYTWATAAFANAHRADPRVRGYRVRVNGRVMRTVYNYELRDWDCAERVSITVGRLSGKDNRVLINAFADNGEEIFYREAAVTCPPGYSYAAPEWSGELSVTRHGEALVLRWEEPRALAGIYGYRVYMDGQPVCPQSGAYFNHVNGACTTRDTFWTVEGADLTRSHRFKVEAADAWWKALDGTGPFHWTYSGPSAVWDGCGE